MASQESLVGYFANTNINDYFYSWGIASAYQRYPQIYDVADIAGQNDSLIWEKIRRDAVFSAAIENRRKAVAGVDWSFVPKTDNPQDKRAAEIVTAAFEEIPHWWRARYNLTSAIFRGSSYLAISGERRALKLPSRDSAVEMWVPGKLAPIDRYRFRLTRKDPGERGVIKTGWQLFSIARREWEDVQNPQHFIRHYYERVEQDLGYGRGLLNSLYFYFRAKEIVFAQGLNGLERWAQGMVIAKIDDMRIGAEGTDNESIVDAYLEVLNKFRSENFIGMSKDDEVDVKWASGSGHTQVKDWLEYLDSGAIRLIQSADPGGDKADGGGYAQAREEGHQKESYYATDRMCLDEDINYSIVRLFWNLNVNVIRAVLKSEGLSPDAQCPSYETSHAERVEPKDEIEIITKMVAAGMPPEKREAYERVGFKIPGENDEVIEAPQQEQGGGFGDMFGGMGGDEGPQEPELEADVGGRNGDQDRAAIGDGMRGELPS